MATSPQSAQTFVPIDEVRDGTMVLRDGSIRAVLIVSSVNFALKSEDEQTAIILQFQNVLNALDFSLQIFIESRRLDIRPYTALLEERFRAQATDLMRIQTREYIEFIKNFTASSEIMTKSFFIVIPYTPASISFKKGTTPLGFLSSIRSNIKSKKTESAAEKTERFEDMQTQLEQRVEVVEQGLARVGLRSLRLGTEEVIELLYKIMNPGELEKPIRLHS
ncbi:MAG: hypothetical protein Q8R39_00060 [bacterium]|nr:hypothetical protein [bacterium]MDZ4284778.1 hypothetical protein [Patescibacteria group bacterium]